MNKMEHFAVGLFLGLGAAAIAAVIVADLVGAPTTGLKVAVPLVGGASLVAMKYRMAGFGGNADQ